MAEYLHTDSSSQTHEESSQQETLWLARAAEIFDKSHGWLGTIDAPNKDGFMALAHEGKDIWNSWRSAYPSASPDFSDMKFGELSVVDFSGFLFPSVDGAPCVKFANCIFRCSAKFTGATFGDLAIFEKTQFWKEAEFSNTSFGEKANFSGAEFSSKALFDSAKFDSFAFFEKASFQDTAELNCTFFGNQANFNGSNFLGSAFFMDATFGEKTTYEKTTFAKLALFNSASFGATTSFRECEFEDIAYFERCKFCGNADFSMAGFHKVAIFNKTEFDSETSFVGTSFKFMTSFSDTKFNGSALFSASDASSVTSKSATINWISFKGASFGGVATFNGRHFLSTTSFGPSEDRSATPRPVRFHDISYFHGCKFNQDTNFDDAEFLASPSPEAARAYRTLKLAMEQLKATREEQKFFRLEMKAEHPSLPWGKRWISTLYSLFSDYGFSLWRPIVWLLSLSLLFSVGYGLLANNCVTNTHCMEAAKAAGVASRSERTSAVVKYTLASVAPVPGLDKMQTELRAPLFGHHGWVPIAALTLEILHKIVALVMVFLFALALRNLFKMKS